MLIKVARLNGGESIVILLNTDHTMAVLEKKIGTSKPLDSIHLVMFDLFYFFQFKMPSHLVNDKDTDVREAYNRMRLDFPPIR